MAACFEYHPAGYHWCRGCKTWRWEADCLFQGWNSDCTDGNEDAFESPGSSDMVYEVWYRAWNMLLWNSGCLIYCPSPWFSLSMYPTLLNSEPAHCRFLPSVFLSVQDALYLSVCLVVPVVFSNGAAQNQTDRQTDGGRQTMSETDPKSDHRWEDRQTNAEIDRHSQTNRQAGECSYHCMAVFAPQPLWSKFHETIKNGQGWRNCTHSRSCSTAMPLAALLFAL